MNKVSSGNSIGEMIHDAREKNHLNQHGLAEKIGGKTKEWLSSIERGSTAPTIDSLLALHEVLTDEAERDVTLPLWLLKWIEAKIRKDVNLDPAKRERAFAALQRLSAQLSQSRIGRKHGAPLSLDDFSSGAFEPLTIIFGDRREPQALTRGDIFAYSVSITDFTFLPRLGLRANRDNTVTISSDKLFVLGNEEYLKREYGKRNLLVIGSPAVNLAARRINDYSVFRFYIAPELKEFERKLWSLKEIDDLKHLRVFWRMAQDWKSPQGYAELDIEKYLDTELSRGEVEALADIVRRLLGNRSAKSIMNGFKKPGFVDPADAEIHSQSTRANNDFGVISLARNPFADNDEHICIMVGGIHGPGTAHALRALGEADFKDHPLGGIIEVELDLFQDWPSRFEKASWRWQTRKYTPEQILANLCNPDTRATFSNLTNAEIEECLAFVQNVAGMNTPTAG